jgi:hypothetical protein
MPSHLLSTPRSRWLAAAAVGAATAGAAVREADEFLRQVLFGRDGSELTTRSCAGAVARRWTGCLVLARRVQQPGLSGAEAGDPRRAGLARVRPRPARRRR